MLLEAYQPLLVSWQNQQIVVMSNLDYHIELVGKQYPKQKMKCGSLVTFTLALLSLDTVSCTASFLGTGWFTFLATFEGGAQLSIGE